MNTLLIASQIVCYGVGIVSASVNIATFVNRRRAKWRRIRGNRKGIKALAQSYRLVLEA